MENNNYPVGFYFNLSFEGEDLAFQEVSGWSKELGMEEVISGGENRFKHRLPTLSKSKNLVLKRAIIPKDSQLIKWCSATFNNGFSEVIEAKDIAVNLVNSEGEISMNWLFYKAYPIKYAVSNLNSQESNVLMETIELAYIYFKIQS